MDPLGYSTLVTEFNAKKVPVWFVDLMGPMFDDIASPSPSTTDVAAATVVASCDKLTYNMAKIERAAKHAFALWVATTTDKSEVEFPNKLADTLDGDVVLDVVQTDKGVSLGPMRTKYAVYKAHFDANEFDPQLTAVVLDAVFAGTVAPASSGGGPLAKPRRKKNSGTSKGKWTKR